MIIIIMAIIIFVLFLLVVLNPLLKSRKKFQSPEDKKIDEEILNFDITEEDRFNIEVEQWIKTKSKLLKI